MYIGFDIGGTSIKAVAAENKKIIRSQKTALPSSLEGLFEAVKNLNLELNKGLQNQAAGMGFAFAADLDLQRENILRSYNIPFLGGQPIKKMLREKLGFENIMVEQDTPCFLLAESQVGAGKNFKNIFYFILGRGIGTALMINGKIVRGSHGAATEGGHMIIAGGEKLKTDDGHTDLEEIASSKIMEKVLNVNSEEAYRKAAGSDKAAQEAFAELGRNLGIGVSNIINIFDPEAVILGGGVMRAKEFILPALKEEVASDIISPSAKNVQILASELDIFGGALGASMLFENGSIFS